MLSTFLINVRGGLIEYVCESYNCIHKSHSTSVVWLTISYPYIPYLRKNESRNIFNALFIDVNKYSFQHACSFTSFLIWMC